MRTLTIADNWKDWKFGDTDAVMTFTALDDNKVPDFSNRTLTFKIASTLNNDLEHPKDFAATATGYIQGKDVILKTEDVKQLTPGNYIVELWAMSNDTQKDAVYPSKGFAQFTIEENSMKVSDVTNIPSMTINAFWNAVMQKVRTLTKGAKGDPGKTPKIVIGSVTKLSPDAQPSATLVPLQSDPNTYTLNLQLPQGVQGEQGLQGIPGVGSKGLDGNNGLTPTIDPKTKHWMIGGTDTGVIAEGQAGKDADPSKYVTIASFNQLRQKDAQQDAVIATKARQDFIINYLSKMNLQPEAFENEAALKAEYPNGKSGLMVTADTGHKWLYVNGVWTDCGQYQGIALAESDRQQLDNALVGDNVLADAHSEPYNDLDKLPANRIVTYATDISSVKNAPNILAGSSNGATVVTMAINPKTVSGAVQMLFTSNGIMYYRVAWGDPGTYGSWKSIRNGDYVQYSGTNVPDVYKDLNNFPTNSEVLITDNIGNLKNIPSQLLGTSYGAAISTTSVGNNNSGTIQKLFVADTNDIYERLAWGGENIYHPWRLLPNGDFYKSGKMTGVKTGSPYDDLNTFPTGQTITIAETPDVIRQIKNLPPISNTAGGLTVRTEASLLNDNIGGIQIAIDTNNVMYHRICWGASGRWGAWRSDSVDEHNNDMILPTLSLFQKVGVVGDSYASGELAFDGQNVDHYEISWLQILARKDGFIGTNFSMGGMSTRTWLTNPKCMPLMQSSDAQDLYILALGINDEALGTSYIGSEADIDSGADTFYGNYGKIIKAIQTKAPQAKLVIATIADSSDTASKFNEAITTIANHFAIPVIVQLDDPLFNSSFYKDNMIGGHPTGPVYASMAEAFERLIGQSMINHLDYYKTFRKDA